MSSPSRILPNWRIALLQTLVIAVCSAISMSAA
jgi:hypothetical protein